ncbi:MAG: acetyl-CoA carboxylase biotin carboxyl carrier protein subunit, partial [Burkholderiaceae bacterium]|nr:acetyl-CoA carboxylase biotin carboxyl carrier protein subunit [Burkholderiaceae bacterium]
PGDSVDFGDTVAILESMKMEIPVESSHSGTIAEILVKEGDVVDEGTVIARLA